MRYYLLTAGTGFLGIGIWLAVVGNWGAAAWLPVAVMLLAMAAVAFWDKAK